VNLEQAKTTKQAGKAKTVFFANLLAKVRAGN
jgi:hypothetical protein